MNSRVSNLSSVRLPSLAEIRAERARREAKAERDRVSRDVERIRARCSTLAGFVREAWHVLEPQATLVWGWPLQAMASHLEAVSRGEIVRLLTNCPPGLMKSLLHSVFWPAWEWGPAGLAHMRFLTSSYSQDNVLRDNTKMRRLVESDWYRQLWPHVQMSSDQNAKGKFENTLSGGREGRPFASMTGGRGDRVIIDDPHSTEQAESEVERRNAVRIFRESISDRLNNLEKSAIVVIMQRLHAEDVSGTILKMGLPYEHLCLPMEYEGPRPATVLGFEDPRTDEGELLLPERFSRKAVEDLKVIKGSYGYAGQYQQRPVPRDGGMFSRSWFDTLPAIPAGTVFVRGWDLAASTGATAAYTAGAKVGRMRDGRFLIANCVRDRLSAGGVETLIRLTAAADGKECRVSIPQDPGQAGKAQAQYLVRQLAGFSARATTESGDKATRAEPLSAQAEARNVLILQTCDPAKDAWIAPFLDEITMFPNGAYKDQTDATVRAFLELMGGPPSRRLGLGMELIEG